MSHRTPSSPFRQGSLDSLCAAYAVLNACRWLFGMRTNAARQWLDDELCHLAADAAQFRAFLARRTDGSALVGRLLARAEQTYPLACHTLFPACPAPAAVMTPRDFRMALRSALSGTDTVLVLRYEQYLGNFQEALVRHWTCATSASEEGLVLYDTGSGPVPLTTLAWEDILPLNEEALPHEGQSLLKIDPAQCHLLRRIRF